MMQGAATISFSRKYRYSLRRTWQEGDRRVCFIMLNPSTADAEQDDPTIIRCVNFAKLWHFDSLEVVNLFAQRATNPCALYKDGDPVGVDNDAWIQKAADRAELVVCGWGTHQFAIPRAFTVCAMLKKRPLYCLGTTVDGSPRHPLYIPKDRQPILFRGALL